MPKEMGHVKNPLTVIAIFAGIAETSGAAILPFLDKDIQGTFVWFLMFFPCLLIALFFGVLYKKHHVLYAPSDYKEDKSFVDLHFTTRGGFKELGREEAPIDVPTIEVAEVVEVPKEQGCVSLQPNPRAGGAVEEPATDEGEGITHPDGGTDLGLGTPGNCRTLMPTDGAISIAALRRVARKKVLDTLVSNFGGDVEIHAQSRVLPNVRFDAVIDSGDFKSVVEFVDMVSDSNNLKLSVMGRLRMARVFWGTLSAQEKKQFVFHLALMHGPESEPMREAYLKDIADLSLAMPFKTEVTLYEYDKKHMTSYNLSA